MNFFRNSIIFLIFSLMLAMPLAFLTNPLHAQITDARIFNRPIRTAINQNTGTLYVLTTEEGINKIVAVDTAQNRILGSIPVDADVKSIVIDEVQNKVFAASAGVGAINVIDGSKVDGGLSGNPKEATINVLRTLNSSPVLLAADPSRERVYGITRIHFFAIDTADNTLAGSVTLGGELNGMALDFIDGRAVVVRSDGTFFSLNLNALAVVAEAKSEIPLSLSNAKPRGNVFLLSADRALNIVPAPTLAGMALFNYGDGTMKHVATESPFFGNVVVDGRRHNAYMVNNKDNVILEIDLARARIAGRIPLAEPFAGVTAVAADEARGEVYFIGNRNGHRVLVLDVVTGEITENAPVGAGFVVANGVTFDSASRRLYLPAIDEQDVFVYDRASNSVTRVHGSGISPSKKPFFGSRLLEYDGNKRTLYALNQFGGSISIIRDRFSGTFDGRDFALEAVVPVGRSPLRMVLDQGGRYLYVTLAGEDMLARLDTKTREVEKVAVGRQPSEMFLNNSGDKAYVLNRLDTSVSEIDLQTFTALPAAFNSMAFTDAVWNEKEDALYVADTTGALNSFVGGVFEKQAQLPTGSVTLAADEDFGKIYAGDNVDGKLFVIDGGNVETIRESADGRGQYSLVYHPVTKNIIAVNANEGKLFVIDTETDTIARQLPMPNALIDFISADPSSARFIAVAPLSPAAFIINAETLAIEERVFLNDARGASDFAFGVGGGYIFLANFFRNNVAVLSSSPLAFAGRLNEEYFAAAPKTLTERAAGFLGSTASIILLAGAAILIAGIIIHARGKKMPHAQSI